MAKYLIGDVVRHWREQSGMSIEELAEGIMNKSNLWKLENGISMPTKKHLEQLFEKLGINPNNLVAIFLDNNLAEVQKLTDALDSSLATGNTTESTRLIAQLESNVEFKKGKFNMQYLLAAKASYAVQTGSQPEKVLEILLSASMASRTSFDENKIATYFLTKTDFTILNMMATQYFKLEDGKNRTINILYGLKKNVEDKCIDKIERGQRYPSIIYNLTKYLGLMGKDENAVSLCNEGIKVCLETNNLRLLPHISYNKVHLLYKINDSVAGEALLREVYYTCCLHQLHELKSYAEKFAHERGVIL